MEFCKELHQAFRRGSWHIPENPDAENEFVIHITQLRDFGWAAGSELVFSLIPSGFPFVQTWFDSPLQS
jgi:hypothetical protein